jgi:hypothetical protein
MGHWARLPTHAAAGYGGVVRSSYHGQTREAIVVATRAARQIGRVRADSNATALVGSGRGCAKLRMRGGLSEEWKASDTVSSGNIQWVQPPASILGPVHYATSMRPTTDNAKSYALRSRFYGRYEDGPSPFSTNSQSIVLQT